MFHLLASIASPSQSDFDRGKVSIAKALVLVLHRFFSKGFAVSRASIFGGGFDLSHRFSSRSRSWRERIVFSSKE